ncbi:hypothetical protein MSG28_014409 [Choristoneura fumiferana]|uniref:Uncharacterized protein n=1 Tax=Choristoneura fumiferana TaxID=7141 RepID=A0ACC0JRF5_CHOFU|nr:hypothetical protein MSG28_014409 [Choristoneura fumiferana]
MAALGEEFFGNPFNTRREGCYTFLVRMHSNMTSPQCAPRQPRSPGPRGPGSNPGTPGTPTPAVLKRYDDITKSQEDKREYRGLELSNRLKVLLISDPTTDKSAAALDVNVGEGVSHILLKPSLKYPTVGDCLTEENEYNKFLSEHGGSSNASTSSDHTTYYFDVLPDYLGKSLDIFAQFFIAPLFTETATGRELSAVNSEHEKNTSSDTWRLDQLNKSTASPDHPYHKFGTGFFLISGPLKMVNFLRNNHKGEDAPPAWNSGRLLADDDDYDNDDDDDGKKMFLQVVGPCARSARIATTILLANPAVKQQCLHCCVSAWRMFMGGGDLLPSGDPLARLPSSRIKKKKNVCHTGNRETLETIPKEKGIDVRKELLKFHDKWYSANIMALVVTGKESLDELEAMVVPLFSAVEDTSVVAPSWQEHPFPPSLRRKRAYCLPVKDLRSLSIDFPIPDTRKHYKSGPGHYLSHLLGHEGPGSLLSELKARGWCNSLVGGTRIGARGFGFFGVQVDLTENGVEHIDDIVVLVFQYIAMLRATKPQRWVWEEQRDLMAMEFRFKDAQEPRSLVTSHVSLVQRRPPPPLPSPPPPPPATCVCSCSSSSTGTDSFTDRGLHEKKICARNDSFTDHGFHDKHIKVEGFIWGVATKEFPMEDVLSAYYLLTEWRPELIDELLDLLTPENVRVGIVAKCFGDKCTQVEPWYGTKYLQEDIDPATIKQWKSVEPIPALHLPPLNEFIPARLELEKGLDPTCEAVAPAIVKDTPLMRLWFKQDNEFKLPKAFLTFDLVSPLAYLDPINCNLTSVWVLLFRDSLQQFAYAAELAGLRWSIGNAKYGISITIDGYDDKQHVLLEKIIEHIVNFKVDPQRFAIMKENHIRGIKNFDAEQPYQHAVYQQALCLSDLVWTRCQLLDAAETITPEMLNEFASRFIRKVHVEGLMFGNLTRERALKIADTVENKLPKDATPLLAQQLLLYREVEIEKGAHYLRQTENSVHKSSCASLYYACGVRATRPNVALELLAQTLSEPCFNVLRTKEQLGYIVFSGVRRSNGVQGLRVIVQSDRHPAYLEQRIEAFLKGAQEYLEEMSEEEFVKHRAALAAQRLERPKRMSTKASQMWSEISAQVYNFDRPRVEVEVLNTINKEELIQFYKEHISDSSKNRQKLSVYIVSTAEGGAGTEENGDSKMPEKEPIKIIDLVEFKSRRRLYAHPAPFITNIPRKGAQCKL